MYDYVVVFDNMAVSSLAVVLIQYSMYDHVYVAMWMFDYIWICEYLVVSLFFSLSLSLCVRVCQLLYDSMRWLGRFMWLPIYHTYFCYGSCGRLHLCDFLLQHFATPFPPQTPRIRKVPVTRRLRMVSHICVTLLVAVHLGTIALDAGCLHTNSGLDQAGS